MQAFDSPLLDPSLMADQSTDAVANRPLICPSCGEKALLFRLTAEDIQRAHPPQGIPIVCAGCREKYRSAARLEVDYPTTVAVRDLGLITVVIVSSIIVFSYLLLNLRLSLPVGTSQIIFLTTAATSLTGLKMTYNELGRRYRFTHNLRWSLHSRYGILSISLVLSGVLAGIILLALI